MNTFTANTVSLGILAANAIILLVFTKVILERFKSRLIKYVLGMIFAYGVLMCLLYLSMKYEFIQTAFQNAKFRNLTDAGILTVVMPALYSVFLVGYFETDRDWKKIRAMMLSVFVNGIFSFIGVIIYYSYLQGTGLQEIFTILKASEEYIDWRFIPPLIGLLILFYFLMKWDYFKYNKK